MGEVVNYQNTSLARIDFNGNAVQVKNLADVMDLARVMLVSGYCPKDMNTVETVAVAIIKGMELGLSPTVAVQSIAVINGRPTIWGDAVPGICMATGQLENFEERIEGEGKSMKAVCIAKRKGWPEKTQEFSVSDAETAGLWSKSGPWKQYPKRMLQMRARGFCLRSVFPDALMGMWLAEELQGTAVEKEHLQNTTPEGFADHLSALQSAGTYHEFKIEYNRADIREMRKTWSNEFNRQIEGAKGRKLPELKTLARGYMKVKLNEFGLKEVLNTLHERFLDQWPNDSQVFFRALDKLAGAVSMEAMLAMDDLDVVLDTITELYTTQKEQGLEIEPALEAEVVECDSE